MGMWPAAASTAKRGSRSAADEPFSLRSSVGAERLAEPVAFARIEIIDVRLDPFAVHRVQRGGELLSVLGECVSAPLLTQEAARPQSADRWVSRVKREARERCQLMCRHRAIADVYREQHAQVLE